VTSKSETNTNTSEHHVLDKISEVGWDSLEITQAGLRAHLSWITFRKVLQEHLDLVKIISS
jgi:hypothetical protein